MDIRNRIKELRIVRPDELAPNPRNWRTHPQVQRDALRGLLASVGITDTLIAYVSERNGGRLTLIDGHERATVDTPWPCLILDLTDDEADLALATHDPLGTLAQPDPAQLAALMQTVASDNAAVQALLDRALRDAQALLPAGDDSDLPPFFDAAKLPGATGGALTYSYLLYIALPDLAALRDAITLLTGGARSDAQLKDTERYAQVDGSLYLSLWRERLANAES